MTSPRFVVLACALLLAPLAACGGGADKGNGNPQCSDGIDNDGDGLIDFPADPGCTSPTDDSEDSPPSPQCSDGRDNDGDGKIDYPNDPGCPSPQGDSEVDDCPTGPSCPQCGNGIDDDGNGLIDYPADPGCSSAGDPTEQTINGSACGSGVTVMALPTSNDVMGSITGLTETVLVGSCGGSGGEDVYQLSLATPKVVVASTLTGNTTIDSVIYIRGAMCGDATTERGCVAQGANGSGGVTLTESLAAGTYYIVVDSTTGSVGTYELTVSLLPGAGTACTGPDDTTSCGTGLLCNNLVCTAPQCSDGLDNDGDGKIDYPNDPGCASPAGNDETDDCTNPLTHPAPSGPTCPQCGDGIDNDGDGKIDYPADTSCTSAAGTSEACMDQDPILALTMPTTMGDNTNAHDNFNTACAEEPGAPDVTYQLELPALTSLTVIAIPDFEDGDFFDAAVQLLDSTCGGSALQCNDFDDNFDGNSTLTFGTLAAGTYYLVVDGDDPTQIGPFSVQVSGTIAPGGSCEGALAVSGALTCAEGSLCKGTMGARTCVVAQCSDGIDNDGDHKIDYPNDPGCSSPDDDDETDTCPGAGCPVCSNGSDDDGDTLTDYPADFGCSSAAGSSEVFCIGETDPPVVITTPKTSGTTVGKHDDETPVTGCAEDYMPPANDLAFALVLPVKVQTLNLSTEGSSIDTVLSFLDANCSATIACNEFDPIEEDGSSALVLNDVFPGNYAIVVDGDDTGDGKIKLNVSGTVAAGTACTSVLFTENILTCVTGTTCTAGTCQ